MGGGTTEIPVAVDGSGSSGITLLLLQLSRAEFRFQQRQVNASCGSIPVHGNQRFQAALGWIGREL